MKPLSPRYVVAAVVVALAAVGVVAVVRHETPRERHARRVEAFLRCVPKELDAARRREVRELFSTFFDRVERGVVLAVDVDTVEAAIDSVLARGRLSRPLLVRIMAQVGTFAWRGDPRFRGTDSGIDHPELNPDAAVKYPLGPDSATVADFRRWLDWMEQQGRDPWEAVRRWQREGGPSPFEMPADTAGDARSAPARR